MIEKLKLHKKLRLVLFAINLAEYTDEELKPYIQKVYKYYDMLPVSNKEKLRIEKQVIAKWNSIDLLRVEDNTFAAYCFLSAIFEHLDVFDYTDKIYEIINRNLDMDLVIKAHYFGEISEIVRGI